MGSFNKGESSSRVTTRTLPGLFNTGGNTSRIGGRIQGLLGTQPSNPYENVLLELLSGRGGNVDSLLAAASQRAGGGVNQDELRRVSSPELVAQEQADIANIQAGLTGTNKMNLGNRKLNALQLLKLAELAMPRSVVGEDSDSDSTSLSFLA